MQRADQDQWKSSEVSRLLALVETERRYYQDVFALLPVPVVIVDGERNLSAVNREFRRRFGLRNTDLSRLRLSDLLPDAGLEAALADVMRSGTPRVGHPVAAPGGASPFLATIQRITGWQAGAEDELLITLEEPPAVETSAAPAEPLPAPDPNRERRRLRAVAEEAKRGATERLAGRLAHVANNLLMIIGGYADELMESLPPEDPRRDDVAEIVKASSRMGSLTQELTTLTRPQSATAAPFSLIAWATTAVARWRLASANDTDLSASTSRQLLDLILFEALRHLRPEPGTARLHIQPRGEQEVEISLLLPGLAVSEETVERIFEPFSGPKEGSDPPLGLAGLVRPWLALQGTIDFEALPGEVPRLVLTCPVAAEGAPVSSGVRTMLVVEDEAGIRSLVAKALERHGYRVLQAGNAAEALAVCESPETPLEGLDLLVTDLSMPGRNGRELAEAVRAKWPLTPVLFVSGYTEDSEMAAQIGLHKLPERTRFLAKPFQVAQLIHEVKTLLAL